LWARELRLPDYMSAAAIADSTNIGPIAFATTHWSVVLAARDGSTTADEALEKLCRTYWRPLYGFARRRGYGPDEAQDLTQGFFALLLERKDFDAVRREKGRLRSYLLVSFKHFIANEHQRAAALKRGEGQALISLEELRTGERSYWEPADTSSADRIFERRWALALLEQVLARLKAEYLAAGRDVLFERLRELLADEPDRFSQAEIAGGLGMTENAVKQAFHRLRQRYRLLLREEVAHTVAAPGDVEDELRHLIAVLRT
jgi:RNA polymerase sigma factor (sigma-70 family)